MLKNMRIQNCVYTLYSYVQNNVNNIVVIQMTGYGKRNYIANNSLTCNKMRKEEKEAHRNKYKQLLFTKLILNIEHPRCVILWPDKVYINYTASTAQLTRQARYNNKRAHRHRKRQRTNAKRPPKPTKQQCQKRQTKRQSDQPTRRTKPTTQSRQ